MPRLSLARCATWLIEPAASVTDPVRRSYARLIAALLLLLLPPVYLLTGLLDLFIYRNQPRQGTDFFLLLAMLPVWITGYTLCRRGRFELAAILLSFLASLEILLSTMTPDGMFSDAIYLLFPVLFSSAVLRWKYTGALVLFDLIGMIVFLFGTSEVDFSDFLAGPLSFFGIGSVMILAMNWHRDRLESYRRAELVASEQRLRTVLETMPTMLVAISEGGMIATWNQECERVTGYTAQEVVGNPDALRQLEIAQNPEFHDRLTQPQDFRDWEWNMRCKDGSFKTVAWTSVAARLPIPGWRTWGIGMDVTARHRAEVNRLELALERERVKVLKRFLDNASHDLRTPLTTLKTNLYLLRRLPDSEKRAHHFEVAESQTAHIEKVLMDMLEMLQVDQRTGFTPEHCDLNSIVQAVVESYRLRAVQKRQNLQFEAATSASPVLVDAEMLKTALNHLLDNAVNYTPEGGTITAQVRLHDRHYVVDVHDTGTGIEPGDLPHIFEPFFRADHARNTRTGGAGLGLTIAQGIVQSHQGTIEAESTPGSGSTFRIYLPVDFASPVIEPLGVH